MLGWASCWRVTVNGATPSRGDERTRFVNPGNTKAPPDREGPVYCEADNASGLPSHARKSPATTKGGGDAAKEKGLDRKHGTDNGMARKVCQAGSGGMLLHCLEEIESS